MKKIIKKEKKNNLGFSLLEILLAVVLLAIVVTPLIQTIYTSMALNKKSRIQMGATDLGQSMIEYFESQTYPDIKDLLEDTGNTVSIAAINYAGLCKDVSSGSYYGQSSTESYTMEERKRGWAQYSALNCYTAIMSGQSDKFICHKSNDDYDFYAINKINSNGFEYDLVIFITPIIDTGDYNVYEVQVDVYYNDYNDPNIVFTAHDRNNLMATYKGSVFNKFD